MEKYIAELTTLVNAVGATNLTIAAFLSIAIAYICYKFFDDADQKIKLTAFFAVMLFAFAVMVLLFRSDANHDKTGTKNGPDEPISEFKLFQILAKVQDDQRASACSLLAEKGTCEEVLAALNGILPPKQSSRERAAVSEAISSGNKNALVEVAQKVSPSSTLADTLLTLGHEKGWDIDVFWCKSSAHDRDRYATATTVANAFASAAKQDQSLASGAPIGRIRVRQLAADKVGKNGNPSAGLVLRSDTNEAEQVAATGALALVASKTGLTFVRQDQNIPGKSDYYLSLFVCK